MCPCVCYEIPVSNVSNTGIGGSNQPTEKVAMRKMQVSRLG